MGRIDGFTGLAPFSGTNSAPSTTTFNFPSVGLKSFLPKAKLKALYDKFPVLGEAVLAPIEKKNDENSDPCQGKPKGFFT